jgi:hypothetical protein
MLPPFILFADHAGTLDVALTSEVRGRVTQVTADAVPGGAAQPSAGPTVALDLYEQILLHGHLALRQWDFDLDYRPSILQPDIELGSFCLQPSQDGTPCSQPQPFQLGSASIGWHDREVRLTASEDAAHGLYNPTSLAPTAVPATQGAPGAPPVAGGGPTTAQPLATQQTLVYFATTTALTLTVVADRRASYSLRASYIARGGLDDVSRAVLPVQYGPRADATFAYAVTRRDQAVTLAYGQGIQFSPSPCYDDLGNPTALTCRPDVQIVSVSEELHHLLERSTSLIVGAGVAEGRLHRDDILPYRTLTFPVANASVTHLFGQTGHSKVTLGVAFGPYVDYRTGLASERGEVDAGLVERLNRWIKLTVSGAGGQTVPTSDPQALTYLRGGVDVAFRVDRSLDFALGELGGWQEQYPFGSFFTAFSYFDVTVHAPELPF